MNIFKNILVERVKNAEIERSTYVRLDKSESTFQHDLGDLKKYINENLSSDSVQIYPETHRLKNDILDYYSLGNNISVSLRPGIDGLINSLFTLCKLYNLKICYGQPNFPMYDIYTRLHDLDYLTYKLSSEHNYDYDEIFEKYKKSDILIIVNPSSPDGVMHKKAFIQEIIDFSIAHNKLLIVDEAYVEFADDVCKFNFIDNINNNIIIFRTFSKAWGLAGLRIGYALMTNKVCEWFEQTRPMYEIGNIDAMLCSFFLKNNNYLNMNVDNIKADRDAIYNLLDSKSVKYIHTQANFININFNPSYLDKFHSFAVRKNILYKSAKINEINYIRLSIVGNTNKYLKDFFDEISKICSN